MNICLFTQEEIKKPLPIQDERAEHIIKILHKKIGETFTAGIIDGKAGTAKIQSIGESITFTFEPITDGKTLFPLIMIVGFPRPIQLKRLLRDVAALGLSEIHLTGTELGEKSYMQSKLVEDGNAQKMLLDGTVQAASTHIPKLFLHKNLNECLHYIQNNEDYAKSQKITLDNVNPDCSLSSVFTKSEKIDSVIAAIGSERGWTDSERNLFSVNDFTKCGMGQRIMRTETAVTVAGSIILDRMGFLN